jgi:hypothetical protein
MEQVRICVARADFTYFFIVQTCSADAYILFVYICTICIYYIKEGGKCKGGCRTAETGRLIILLMILS